jgi:hypothetical protein
MNAPCGDRGSGPLPPPLSPWVLFIYAGFFPDQHTAQTVLATVLVASPPPVGVLCWGPQPQHNLLRYGGIVYSTLSNNISVNYPPAHVSDTARSSVRGMAGIVIRTRSAGVDLGRVYM